MNENPQDKDMPEPVDPFDQAMDASQPEETPDEAQPTPVLAAEVPADTAETTAAAKAPGRSEDYVSEIRQSLASEESSSRRTGGLIRRLTGSLRRTTGSLRGGTGPVSAPASSSTGETGMPSDIGDDFLVDRLAGASVSDPSLPPPLFEEDAETWAALQAEAQATTFEMVEEAPQLAGEGTPEWLLETGLSDDTEPAADWMSEIRLESGEQDGPPAAGAPPESTPAKKSQPRSSRPLRSFFTGLLRRGDEGSKLADEIPDDLVIGRLERSQGIVKEDDAPQVETLPAGMEAVEEPFDESLLFGEAPSSEELDAGDATTFLDDLSARFGGIDTESAPPGEVEISPEDEALLWGDDSPESTADAVVPLEGLTFTPQDVWADEEEEPPADGQPRTWTPLTDDAYAATFLTGQEVVPDQGLPFSQDRLLHQALDSTPQPEEVVSVDDIRAIAMEDYQEVGDAPLAPRMEDYVSPLLLEQEDEEEISYVLTEEEQAEQKATEARASKRIALEGLLKKVLVVEAVLVVLALLVAIPFFVFMIARGPVYKVGYLLPRPLPENMPYPTGIQLPGGWYFRLQKSNFVEGQWKPIASEWLEGTELRRVVALPWNPQTEAVIHSFKMGDTVLLDMSNNDSLAYTVSSIERVSQGDTTVLDDRSPSLVIVLYQEKAGERWVVFCKP